MSEYHRLSEDQLQRAQQKAQRFRLHIEAQGRGFADIFRIAAQQIEADVDSFCSRAEILFEEIESFGQEPVLDNDWLAEVVGEKDSFYFSTDSFLTKLPLPAAKRRGRGSSELNEVEVTEAVEEAIASMETALSVAHREEPNQWIDKIYAALQKRKGTATFKQLQKITGLSSGALFLGLLLGHDLWRTQQQTFYGEVLVRLSCNIEMV